jgi:esterase/lipase superfamily enzyme
MTDTVYVVTNRPRVLMGGFGPPPLQDSYDSLSFGMASVQPSADPAVAGALDPGGLAGSDPATTPEPAPALIDFVAAWLAAASQAGKLPLLSVHGYDYTYAEAVVRTGDVGAWYAAAQPAAPVTPLLFTWPSMEGLSTDSYLSDRGRAQASAAAFARTIVAIDRAWQGSGKPTMLLLAHSMGNFALDNALGLLAGTGHPMSANLFAQVLLAGPDVDVDTFAAGGMRLLLKIAAATTVCVNRQDFALNLSSHILGKPRLGKDGPANAASLPVQVSVVDYSMAAAVHGPTPPGDTGPDYWGHQYYRTNPRVRDDMAQILRNVVPGAVQGRIPGAVLVQTDPSAIAGRLYVLPYQSVLQQLASIAPPDLGGAEAPPQAPAPAPPPPPAPVTTAAAAPRKAAAKRSAT